jgi:ribosomal 50S subunit-recycling heat shock protein
VRIDVFLHKVCLLKSRTLAGEACDRGKVRVDGAPVRASRPVRPGDEITVDFGSGLLEIEVLAVPEGNVARKEAPEYYRILRDERNSRPIF